MISVITSETDRICDLFDDAARCFARGEDGRGYVYRDIARAEVRKLVAARMELRRLVEECDGPAGVRADGSNIPTLAAHAALGDMEEE